MNIREMAITSGLCDKDLSREDKLMTDYGNVTEEIAKFANMIAAAEREECKNRIIAMHQEKQRDPDQGVTLGYEPRLQDYLDALYPARQNNHESREAEG